MLQFLHYADKVQTINPQGCAALLTLWSKPDYVLKRLKSLPPSLAAVSNYFGDGISQLLVNLLYNPQITDIFITGHNRAGSLEELQAFFTAGVEEITLNGSKQRRVRGTTRLINAALTGPELFGDHRPRLRVYEATDDGLERLWADLNVLSPATVIGERLRVDLIEPKVEAMPSVQQGHQVIDDSLLSAWREALFLVMRFGLPTQLAKGMRKELLNLKVVITEPAWADAADYEAYGLSLDKVKRYVDDFMRPDLPPDTSYTYGHRLQTYFGFNAIEVVCQRLAADAEDRKCYISLWDQAKDLADGRGHPCWVGAFFRMYAGSLTLNVTFRTHRIYTAYIDNLHALMALQAKVAERLDVMVGPLTVLSHSISIDPAQLSLVEGIVAGRKWKLKNDGRGDLVFALVGNKIVVEHKLNGLVIGRYEGSNAEAVAHKLANDYVVSDLNHSLYIGRQLGKLQMCLKHGLPYDES